MLQKVCQKTIELLVDRQQPPFRSTLATLLLEHTPRIREKRKDKFSQHGDRDRVVVERYHRYTRFIQREQIRNKLGRQPIPSEEAKWCFEHTFSKTNKILVFSDSMDEALTQDKTHNHQRKADSPCDIFLQQQSSTSQMEAHCSEPGSPRVYIGRSEESTPLALFGRTSSYCQQENVSFSHAMSRCPWIHVWNPQFLDHSSRHRNSHFPVRFHQHRF